MKRLLNCFLEVPDKILNTVCSAVFYAGVFQYGFCFFFQLMIPCNQVSAF